MKISTPDQETLVVSAFPWGYWLFGLFFWAISVVMAMDYFSSGQSTCTLMPSGTARCDIDKTLLGMSISKTRIVGVREITIGHKKEDGDSSKSYFLALWTTKGVHKLPGSISLSRHRKTGQRFQAWKKRRSSQPFVFTRRPNWWMIFGVLGCLICGLFLLKERWRRVVFDARMRRCYVRSWGLFGRDNRKIDFSAIKHVWADLDDAEDYLSYTFMLTVGDEEIQISNNTSRINNAEEVCKLISTFIGLGEEGQQKTA